MCAGCRRFWWRVGWEGIPETVADEGAEYQALVGSWLDAAIRRKASLLEARRGERGNESRRGVCTVDLTLGTLDAVGGVHLPTWLPTKVLRPYQL